jgi:hypothetical protein
MNNQTLDLIEHFARTLGIEGLAFDEDGIIELEVGESIAITIGIDEQEEVLFLVSEVFAQAASLAPAILRRLLITNGRLAAGQGPSFAIMPEVGSLLLQQRIPLAGLSYPDFERIWLSFIETQEASTAKLNQLSSAEAVTQDTPPDSELSLEEQHRLFVRI